MFTHSSKGAVGLTGFLAVLLFTLTSNVVFESISPSSAWAAGDVSQRDTESETADASKDAKGKLTGAADGATGFFGGILGWITGVTDSINKMWGMENGGGMASVVNGVFYFILIVAFAFGGKMILNIFKDSVGKKVDERYQKPQFRKGKAVSRK